MMDTQLDYLMPEALPALRHQDSLQESLPDEVQPPLPQVHGP